jgi:hypothetical protein
MNTVKRWIIELEISWLRIRKLPRTQGTNGAK